ncbi:unnamed protein product, partial [Allacma fusca]
MSSFIIVTFGICVMLVFAPLSGGLMNGKPLEYKITTTWDNQTVDAKQVVTLNLSSAPEGLAIDIHCPFHNEKLPSAKSGRFSRLFDFEGVALFFLSSSTLNYLELQFGPGGHYLAYYLNGVRDVRNDSVIISNYEASINKEDDTWTGRAIIPTDVFPAGVDSFNAFSLHGKNPKQYMALYPVPFNASQVPNMHNIASYRPIDLSKLIEVKESIVPKVHISSGNSLLPC